MKETKYAIAMAFVAILFYFLLIESSKGNVSGKAEVSHANLGFVKPEQRLLRLFSTVSSGAKLRLQGPVNEIIYNKNTIPKPFNDSVKALIQKMIDSIQSVTRQEYFMKRIENLYIQRSSDDTNKRYIADFFIYDVKNYYTLRLIADIVSIRGEIYLNYLNVQSGSNPTLLNKYDLKFNQMGILLKENMFHENIRALFDTYYSNNFEVIGISEMDAGSRDVTKVFSLGSMLQLYFPSEKSPESLRMLDEKGLIGQLESYLPPDQTNTISPQFCDPAELTWDSLGVPHPPPNKSKSCILQNSSDQAVMNHPYFAPGTMYGRSSDDQYQWLKDPARSNIIRASGYRA